MLDRREIVFKADTDTTITYDYPYKVMTNLYRFISEINPDKEAFLHNKGYKTESGHVYKFFNHTLRFKNVKFQKDNIFIPKSGKIILIVSGAKEIIDIIADGAFKSKQLSIENSTFVLENIIKSKKINFSNTMEYKALSPIVSRTKNEDGEVETVSICNTEKYFRNLAINAIRKYQLFYNKPFNNDNTPLYFDTDENFSDIKEKSILIKNGGYLRGYLFNIKVECEDLDMQRILYYMGAGEKNSLGFGTLEYVRG